MLLSRFKIILGPDLQEDFESYMGMKATPKVRFKALKLDDEFNENQTKSLSKKVIKSYYLASGTCWLCWLVQQSFHNALLYAAYKKAPVQEADLICLA